MLSTVFYHQIHSPGRKVLMVSILAVLCFFVGAQETDAAVHSPNNLLDWGLLIGVFAVLWLLFYKGLYPLFLRYYRPEFCKFLFWSLYLLYALAWLHLSLYVLFDIGFYYEWARWTAVFLSFLWLIWFAVVFSRRRTA